MNFDFLRVACAVPHIVTGNCEENAQALIAQIKEAEKIGTSLLAFPELCLSGSTCGDFFSQSALLQRAFSALEQIVLSTQGTDLLVFSGLPLSFENRVLNAMAVLQNGAVKAFVVKNRLSPDEKRNFSPLLQDGEIEFRGEKIPLLKKGNFRHSSGKIKISVAFGEEVFHQRKHQKWGNLIINPSAYPYHGGNFRKKTLSLSAHCEKLSQACVFVNCGWGESTTDFVHAGEGLILEKDTVVAAKEPFSREKLIFADVDFSCLKGQSTGGDEAIPVALPLPDFSCGLTFSGKVVKNPFLQDENLLSEALLIQSHGLAKRFSHCGAEAMVLGVSGGLDSTLALLVCHEATKLLDIPPSSIHAISMPCFGTTGRTKNNARDLAEALNTNFRQISIEDAVLQHFRDIGHDEKVHSSVYENSQARERTQILMDFANGCNGLVVGTGDLSEAALGWATFNGDSISMYNVNGSIPKTVVQKIVAYYAENCENAKIASILKDILATPISPELLPPENGKISQSTEEILGPYELHDFFLWHFCKNGFSPEKILFLAENVFHAEFSREDISRTLEIFLKRFPGQQFKRSCSADCPAVFPLSLSPRAGYKIPSDARPDFSSLPSQL